MTGNVQHAVVIERQVICLRHRAQAVRFHIHAAVAVIFAHNAVGQSDEQVKLPFKIEPVWDAVADAVLADIRHTVAIDIRMGSVAYIKEIRHAVTVAIRFADIWNSVAIHVFNKPQLDLPRIGNAGSGAIRFADVGNAVLVHIGFAAGDQLAVQYAGADAILTFIGYAVAVYVFTLARGNVDGVINAVAVAVIE
jgi:hypothetical protein